MVSYDDALAEYWRYEPTVSRWVTERMDIDGDVRWFVQYDTPRSRTVYGLYRSGRKAERIASRLNRKGLVP